MLEMKYENIVQKSFGTNIMFMKLVGLYPYDAFPKIYTLYAYTFYAVFTAPTPLLAIYYYIDKRETDIKKIVEGIYMTAQIAVLLIKLLPFKNHPQRTRKTIESLNKDIFLNHLPEQKHIIDGAVEVCRKMYSLFFSFCAGCLILWPIRVLVHDERRLPLELWLPFNPLEDFKVYLSVFLYIMLGTFEAISEDLQESECRFPIKSLWKKKGPYQRAEEQVSRESETMCIQEREELKARIIYKQICHCIDHYDAIYEFVEDLEKTYSLVVFSQFVASIMVICISCLQLSTVSTILLL
ncbi:hypothetical protein NQ314_009746 [Rhamnusium bicolor]|uniref:Uncharacterized protein n=1 Tax=Rhamnusium bicolor TaxID=1586634 RepID=A0AAV8XY66_9CUCU|nr:hypothetical protein NQ314_009746 [Rhamnusium bicolor]